MLSLSKLHLSEVMDISSKFTLEQDQLFSRSMQLIDEACQEIRNISHNLMPGSLIRLGLLAAIKDLIRKINTSKKIHITLDSNFEETRFDENVEISIYRVIQEIFNNILKHACASEVLISLRRSGEKNLELSIADNGIGFDTSEIANSSGIGWKNIYSRLTMINGSMEINSVKSNGTSINIRVFL
jgi:signal transduction histidine kinase